MTTIGSHMGLIDFSTLLIIHPLKNAVNEIPSKGAHLDTAPVSLSSAKWRRGAGRGGTF